ncbi:SUMF1/EgtB/PvdO family nonheme iron enzyme [Actinoplanes sp. NPDC049265]|uniref:SUMF1/EgtB/PvdO family nonheme iron enzyme n=1 Tax=Actinoplanes sp. NPDC049265 TaxID=3363902 RepID=UPI00371D681B
MNGAPPKVFISYQRDSAHVAVRLHAALNDAGFVVWLDTEQIRHTDRWSVAVDQALRESDSMVLLLTQAANRSVEVFNEWFYFYRMRKPLHVVRLDDVQPHYQLMPFQRIDWAGRTDDELSTLAQQLIDAINADPDEGRRAPAPAPDTVVTTPLAPARNTSSAFQALQQAIRSSEQSVALRPDELQKMQLHMASTMEEYYLTCYARWCGPQYQLDRRFVRLNLVYDEGTGSPDRWVTMPSVRESDDLNDVLENSNSFAYVLLGAPGSGKTTLLRRLEMDIARKSIMEPHTRSVVPFSVSLAEFGLGHGGQIPDPLEWLQQKWSGRNPQLPDLRELLNEGRVLLLVDGLNELAHREGADLRLRIDAWRAFLYEQIRDIPGNRALFSCRTLDYGAMLSTKDVGVPHIRLEPMTQSQVFAYVDLHLPEQTEMVRASLLRDPRTLSFYRTPYMLRLLVSQVRTIGTVPVGRADAFSSMIRELLRREILAANPRLADSELLTEREQRRLRDGVRDPMWLPSGGQFIPALTRLAYQMQTTKLGHDKGSVVVDYETAVVLLNGLARLAEASLHVGFDTGILDEHEETVRFFHQLLQEFFAARQLAIAEELPHVAIDTQAHSVTPDLETQLSQLAPGEPLPPLPSTGWEETTIMAAALTPDPDTFVRRVLGVNPGLAGRCVASADVQCSADVHRETADRLVTGVADPEQDLRARISFGRALGLIDDPRFETVTGAHGNALLPKFAQITAGTHLVGADRSPYPLESPAHEVSLPAFEVAVTPVTNAEYALFIAAGGYQDERWWRTDAARQWLSGDGLLGQIADEWIKKRNNLRRRPRLPVEMLAAGTATLVQAVGMVKLTGMTDEQLGAALAEVYSVGNHRAPAYWHDFQFNSPSCPVVGVSIYEAEAYCAWLSATTGQSYRLPTEHQWEVAAGIGGTVYPYGDIFDQYSSNTFELHIRTTTPVGIFPTGVTSTGCHDMSGNVFEWTASEYRPYPYDGGLRGSDVPGTARICRGGSWRHHQIRARVAYRGRGQCFVRNDDLGFRLARHQTRE